MAGVRLVIQFTAESEADADQRVKEMAERCLQVQKEPGCVQFEVFRSAVRPNVYALIEQWQSDAALETHLAHMPARPGSRPGVTMEKYEHQVRESL
jgi:quinol monooxygenase YgiN